MLRIIIATFALVVSTPAYAETAKSPLQFYNPELNSYIDAPGVATEIDVDINGAIARIQSIQYFYNNTDQWQEAVYTWPLPEDAAVDKLVMIIGDRRVLGFVAEKEKARTIYEEAKKAGKGAALVEQHRSNIFRTSLANIPPRSYIAIETGYQSAIKIDKRDFSFRLPMAVTPRYDEFNPEELMTLASAGPQNSYARDVRERIALFDFKNGNNPFSLKVSLDAGFDASSIASPSHGIKASGSGDVIAIETDDKILPGKQDFILEWSAPESAKPLAFLHQEASESGTFTHVTILPPSIMEEETGHSPKRQITMIIDTSGSMSGPSIVQAKAALKEAITDLSSQDLFNVIRFSSDMQSLFNREMPATPDNKATALQWVNGLQATGGTRMMPAIEKALGQKEQDGYLRQIVFMTDGAVGYESRLGEYIRNNVGKARFFAVGIGAAPNAELMRTIARQGRGAFTYISDTSEIKTKMAALFGKMKQPAVTDLSLKVAGGDAEIIPANLPDLLDGETVQAILRTREPVRMLTVQGRRKEAPWSLELKPAAADADGVGKLYARAKINDIALSDPRFSAAGNERKVTELALEHQIMSAFTSLVAVDEEVLRPNEAGLISRKIDPNTPEGWQLAEFDPFEASQRYYEHLNKKNDPQAQNDLKHGISLPKTATSWEVGLMTSLMLMMVAGLMLWERRDAHEAQG